MLRTWPDPSPDNLSYVNKWRPRKVPASLADRHTAAVRHRDFKSHFWDGCMTSDWSLMPVTFRRSSLHCRPPSLLAVSTVLGAVLTSTPPDSDTFTGLF